jgi:tRNA threonylcarbamoyladenosine biosynthesis protein TsaE
MELTLGGLQDYARQFVTELPGAAGPRAHFVGLQGELGSGKTTFVQSVARELGVTEDVTSPTFVIAQNYKTSHPVFQRLVHIDAYRLSPDEPDTIGFADVLADPTNLIFVEWPENASYMMQYVSSIIQFETINESMRRISVK